MKKEKAKIITRLRKKLEMRLKSAEEQINRNIEHSKDAPGAMQSHHDWDKDQYGKLADQQKETVVELQSSLEVLKSLDAENDSMPRVGLGSLVEASEGGSKRYYFVLPFGGESVKTRKLGEVAVVSIGSPAGKALFGSQVEDVLKIGSRETEIRGIY